VVFWRDRRGACRPHTVDERVGAKARLSDGATCPTVIQMAAKPAMRSSRAFSRVENTASYRLHTGAAAWQDAASSKIGGRRHV
jgi:hypothetical protein